MTRILRGLALAILPTIFGVAVATAQVPTSPVPLPVQNPAFSHASIPTQSSRVLGEWGENLVGKLLKQQGFEVHDGKVNGIHGVDKVAIRRDGLGTAIEIKIVEAKTHNGKFSGLGKTGVGPQMSEPWLKQWFDKLKGTNPWLADEVGNFSGKTSISLGDLGEVWEVNRRDGIVTVRDPRTLVPRGPSMPIPGNLAQEPLPFLISRAPGPTLPSPSAPLHSENRQLRKLQSCAPVHALERANRTPARALEAVQRLRGSRRGLAIVVRRLGVYAAIANDAWELFDHVHELRLGKLTQQEFVTALARSGGGIAGAWAGASSGAWIGGKIGLLGGPFWWITVPIGSTVGTVVGGFVGYTAGREVGQLAAERWYGSLDSAVREQVNEWIMRCGVPSFGR